MRLIGNHRYRGKDNCEICGVHRVDDYRDCLSLEERIERLEIAELERNETRDGGKVAAS